MLDPGQVIPGIQSYICIQGGHNRLDGTFFRAYADPNAEYNQVSRTPSPCSTDFRAKFYNFAQVDVDECQD